MYTPPCVQQIAGGRLLCDKGSSAGCSVMTQRAGIGGGDGREAPEGGAICTCIHMAYTAICVCIHLAYKVICICINIVYTALCICIHMAYTAICVCIHIVSTVICVCIHITGSHCCTAETNTAL